MRYAEDANYWQTTVSSAKSQTQIMEMLGDFGVANIQVTQGLAGGRTAWLIRFQWNDATYRFTFTPLECRKPEQVRSFGRRKRTHDDQARYQMGRIAYHFVKAVLTAAEAQPAALFGFVELPRAGAHPSGLPVTAAEMGVEGMTALLPDIDIPLLEE